MKTMLKKCWLIAVLSLVSVAAIAADPVVGEWKLNVAKSSFKPGPGPKSQIRIYAETKQGMLLTVKTVAADGTETTATSTFKDDGFDYPITGNPAYETIAVKRVDDFTVNSTQKKGGKVVGHSVRSVAKDGKTMNFRQMDFLASGKMTEAEMVFDKQ
jgi:hypothetical protein